MRKHFLFSSCLLALLALIILTPWIAFSQEKEEDLTKLPTIVVKGKDRSYLQIIRPKEISYMPYRGRKKKSEIFYPVKLPPKETYREIFFFKPYIKAKLIAPEIIEKPPPAKIPQVFLSREYRAKEPAAAIKKERIEKFFPEIILPKKGVVRKRLILYLPEVKVPEKPRIEFLISGIYPKPVPLLSPEYPTLGEIKPGYPKEFSMQKSYIEPYLKKAEERKTPLVIKAAGFPEIIEEKTLIRPPLTVPPLERVSLSEKIEKQKYPGLFLSLGLDDKSGFSYGINYGGEREDRRYLLTFKREFSPSYMIYTPDDETLSKDKDLIKADIGWGSVGVDDTNLVLKADHSSLDLPGAEKRKDVLFSLHGKTNALKGWKLNVWGESSAREDKNTIPEKYTDLAYGARISTQPGNLPLLIEGEIGWDNLRKTSPVSERKTKHQALLQLDFLHPTFVGKNFLLEPVKIGVKGIKNESAQITGSGGLSWFEEKRGKYSLKVSLGIKKEYYLPSFSQIYIPQDFSLVNLEIEPVNTITYTFKTAYSRKDLFETSLELFSQEGDDIVWVYSSSEKGLRAQTVNLSRQGVKIEGKWFIKSSVILEPFYTWQTLTNRENQNEVIPHQPENRLGLLLTIKLREKEKETLSFQAKLEMESKKYYDFNPASTIDPSSLWQIKLTYKRKNWEAFIRAENRDFYLSRDFKLPEGRIDFGVSLKLLF
ncbi:hypothetical protein J7L81_04475 [Candidatus Aerophobetes bacterium]|nr:hypothetical protein [Candidatus Aerophobetes bacterium]